MPAASPPGAARGVDRRASTPQHGEAGGRQDGSHHQAAISTTALPSPRLPLSTASAGSDRSQGAVQVKGCVNTSALPPRDTNAGGARGGWQILPSARSRPGSPRRVRVRPLRLSPWQRPGHQAARSPSAHPAHPSPAGRLRLGIATVAENCEKRSLHPNPDRRSQGAVRPVLRTLIWFVSHPPRAREHPAGRPQAKRPLGSSA